MREIEIQPWVALKTTEEKLAYAVTDELRFAMDRFFFNHYCLHFRSGMFARCNRSMSVPATDHLGGPILTSFIDPWRVPASLSFYLGFPLTARQCCNVRLG